ncbi:MAG: zinc-dependent metalloprotease, partial [Flavobacteriaceae bacterium]|nr:zinc-dependent metalloprotease [Flavobacteriaceae bacterium]
VLEDVFVPLYFFHRFQVEAATKVVGGLNYNYAVKGDGQFTTKIVDAGTQKKALNSILKTLDAETLAIPKNKLNLFPPRAYGYGRSRESFKGKTGVGFDALSAASTASDMTLGLLLHPERANRMVQQKAIDNTQLGLAKVLQLLINDSFKKSHKDDYINEIHHMVNVNVLKYIMNLAVNDKSYFQVNAIANETINSLYNYLNKAKGPTAYTSQYIMLMKEFKSKPEKFKLKNSPKIPDGSPIGSFQCTLD